jgi:tetratricopeptide (TPR) repeat protein
MKVAAATLISLLAATAPVQVHAQAAASAEQLFREGREAMLSGNYADAERALKASLTAEVSAAALLNLAVVEEHLGDLLSARSYLEQLLGLLDPKDERYAVGLQLMEALDQRLARVEARAPAIASEQDRPVASPSPEPMQQQAAPLRQQGDADPVVSSPPVATYLLAGVGVGAIGVTVGTGIAALNKKDEALSECPRKLCTERGLGAAADARRYAAISTISLAAAATSLGVAAWLYFTPPRRPANGSLAIDVSLSREQSRVLVSGAF